MNRVAAARAALVALLLLTGCAESPEAIRAAIAAESPSGVTVTTVGTQTDGLGEDLVVTVAAASGFGGSDAEALLAAIARHAPARCDAVTVWVVDMGGAPIDTTAVSDALGLVPARGGFRVPTSELLARYAP